MQALPTIPEDVTITEHRGNFILQIGLQNGVLLRTSIDSVTGEISDTRTRYLGTKSVKLFKVKTEGESAVLAVSSRSWLSYRHQQRFHLTPLSYEALDSATGFRYSFSYNKYLRNTIPLVRNNVLKELLQSPEIHFVF